MGEEFLTVARLEFDSVEWDENKRLRTLEKRKIDFVAAVQILEKPHISKRSDRNDEIRFLAIGKVRSGDLLTIIYTIRGVSCRIISARKVRPDERRAYLHAVSTPQDERSN